MDVEDIILNISHFLSCKQIAANRRVNKQWSRVCTANVIWEQFFRLHFDPNAAEINSKAESSWFQTYAAARILIPEFELNANTPDIETEQTTKKASKIEIQSQYRKPNVLAFKYYNKKELPSNETYKACVIATCLEIADFQFEFDSTVYIGRDNRVTEHLKAAQNLEIVDVPQISVPFSRVLYCTTQNQLEMLYAPSEPCPLPPLSTTLGISPVSTSEQFNAFILYNHFDLNGEEVSGEDNNKPKFEKYQRVLLFPGSLYDDEPHSSFSPMYFNAGGYWYTRHNFYCCWDQEARRIYVIPHGETEFIY